MSKKNEVSYEDNNIITLPMEEVMSASMLPYAQYVIMERALPRVEDGLKPVQRRILYNMSEIGVTPDKPYKKSARIVGDTLGKYHPHGDTSVYEAMVRMAQGFNMRAPLVDGHGNFGSIDGDNAAAMRYTEARMSPIAMMMIQNIEKETVPFRLNFDDSLKEPDMLPARFPNLLVNGASGIAVALATNIPPHNLGEVIDGVICRIENPSCNVKDVMKYIKGPDFPTGGYCFSEEDILEVYSTGKGKLTLRAKTHIEKGQNGRQLIVITELPYQVNKANMLQKILTLSETKREMFSGIYDIKDESDRTGMRAVIEVKAGADAEAILNCLYKYSDLQITFSANMVAIADGRPMQLNLLQMIDYYISFQKEIVTRRIEFDLKKAKMREHILSGLMVAVLNIDRVIKIIRGSKNPPQAREQLMEEFDLTKIQAQAILDMRLARLTALEIEILKEEYESILNLIAKLEAVLSSEKLLFKLIINEHLEVKEKFADDRRTRITKEKEDICIDENAFLVVDECVVCLTSSGFIKRILSKTFKKGMETGPIDEDNRLKFILETKTNQKVRIFTSCGNMFTYTVGDIPEHKFKDKGVALNSIFAGILPNEEIVAIVGEENQCTDLAFVTKGGMIKKVDFNEFNVKKSRIAAIGLKEGDGVAAVFDIKENDDVCMVTKKGINLTISGKEFPLLGKNAKGVIGMRLSAGDEIICAGKFALGDKKSIVLLTDLGYAKLVDTRLLEVKTRGGKGASIFGLLKNGQNGKQIAFASLVGREFLLAVKTGENTLLLSEKDIPKQDIISRGAKVALKTQSASLDVRLSDNGDKLKQLSVDV
ncbi:MAG: DNA topoisomerase (ATP-hydrolyzing) [Eubacteriales bacterium]